MRRILPFATLALAGCVTTVDDIRGREVRDDVTTARSVSEVRDCLLQTVSLGRTPIVTGDSGRTEILFQTPEAGAVFHYELTARADGSRVVARRKNNIAEGFNAGRRCYPAS